MPKKSMKPFTMGYNPEFDTSQDLVPEAVSIHKWRRTDKVTELSLLSQHFAMPRKGHLEEAVHVMANMGHKYYSRLAYSP